MEFLTVLLIKHNACPQNSIEVTLVTVSVTVIMTLTKQKINDQVFPLFISIILLCGENFLICCFRMSFCQYLSNIFSQVPNSKFIEIKVILYTVFPRISALIEIPPFHSELESIICGTLAIMQFESDHVHTLFIFPF